VHAAPHTTTHRSALSMTPPVRDTGGGTLLRRGVERQDRGTGRAERRRL